MQLFFETERCADIDKNMTALEESLDQKLVNGLTGDNKEEVCDGNKENIQSKDNVILDTLGKAANDLIDDINASNIFTEQELSNDEKEQSVVQDLVTAVINGMENENFLLGNDENVDESHSANYKSTEKELNEVLEVENLIEPTESNQTTPKHQLNTASEEIVANEEIKATEGGSIEEGNNIHTEVDKEEESCPVGEDNAILLHDDLENDDVTPFEDDSENRMIENTVGENKIHCVDDEEATISDEDKEVSLEADTNHILNKKNDVPMNEDIPSATIVEDSGDIQLVTEEANLVDDLLLKENIAHKESDPKEQNIPDFDMDCDEVSEVRLTIKEKNETIDLRDEDLTTNDDDEVKEIVHKESDPKEQNIPDIPMDCDEVSEVSLTVKEKNQTIDLRDEDLTTNDDDEVKDITNVKESKTQAEISNLEPDKVSPPPETISNISKNIDSSKAKSPIISKLSLDILSDDDEETDKTNDATEKSESTQKCIDIEDDDDVMVIDEVVTKNNKTESKETTSENLEIKSPEVEVDVRKDSENKILTESLKEPTPPSIVSPDCDSDSQPKTIEKPNKEQQKLDSIKPLLPEQFLQSAKKNLADMTRDDLEEFCILKIVEGVVERSSLNEIKSKLKIMAQSIDEYRKKATMLTKQNRDLQVVLKSVQEEQKKRTNMPIVPLKITRSVGMQVVVAEVKPQKSTPGQASQNNNANKQLKTSTNQRAQKTPNNTQSIPVPRLIPAAQANAGNKITNHANAVANSKVSSSVNGITKTTVTPKAAEKRPHNKTQSVTVDLTDDEPPVKVSTRNTSTPPVRLVPSQNLLASTRQQFTSNSSPRKVYIPISGQQGQAIRSGQTIVLKSVPPSTPRPRCPPPHMVRAPQNQGRIRHPAPLPEPMKQYQPPNWKSLPPAPELKLSKVENGIVISWKIEGYQNDSYEEIASYQLFAYQETASPPNTALWKKIGDVKALPLPMACTLTQFMAGFKYFFAVRAVDIRSRLGPFSLPGSILLLNKI